MFYAPIATQVRAPEAFPSDAAFRAKLQLLEALGDAFLLTLVPYAEVSRGELSAAITGQLPEPLRAWCPGCKVHHVPEGLFRLIGVHGAFVITRRGKESTYVRADKVLGKRRKPSATKARAELLRRYLRCFGPTTAPDFAAWVGIVAAKRRRTGRRSQMTSLK